MIQKRRCIILGLIISSVGILILLNSLRLNGFAISETFNDFRSYLLPLAFFIGGILIASSGDSLQAYFEAREAENPSPSLEDKLQSPEEAKYFAKRGFADKWAKKLFGKERVNRVPQDKNKYIQEVKLGDIPKNYEEKIKKFVEKKNAENSKFNYIKEAFHQVIKDRRKLKENSETPGRLKDFVDRLQNYSIGLELREDLWEQLGNPLSARVQVKYNKIKPRTAESAVKFRGKPKDLIKDVRENNMAVSFEAFTTNTPETEEYDQDSALSSPISDRLFYLKKLKKMGLFEGKLPSKKRLLKEYENTKTVPISSIPKEYTFIHALPSSLDFDSFSSVRGSSGKFIKKCPSPSEALDCLITKRPWISASSIPPVTTGDELTRYAGVILKEGNILDASPEDFFSIAKEGELGRYRGKNDSGTEYLPVEDRVIKSLKANDDYNEFIIKDYSPKGIYLNLDKIKRDLKSENANKVDYVKEYLSQILDSAKKYNLKLNTLKNGKLKGIRNPEEFMENLIKNTKRNV